MEQKSKDVRSNLIGLERQEKKRISSGNLVDSSIGSKQLATTKILRCDDFTHGMCLLRKEPFSSHCMNAGCSQSRPNHCVLDSVYNTENTLFSQSEQSSDSRICELNVQVTRSVTHWFRSCGAICCCCSAPGTEQLPSSFRTTWPRWISSQSWS